MTAKNGQRNTRTDSDNVQVYQAFHCQNTGSFLSLNTYEYVQMCWDLIGLIDFIGVLTEVFVMLNSASVLRHIFTSVSKMDIQRHVFAQGNVTRFSSFILCSSSLYFIANILFWFVNVCSPSFLLLHGKTEIATQISGSFNLMVLSVFRKCFERVSLRKQAY